MGTIEMPDRIAKLPRDDRGYPVPWFVAWVNGKPDFRVIEADRIIEAVKQRRCWVCGEKLGRFLAFLIGPMCAVNRITSEPPSHRECAIFAARVCPFLTMPKMKRNERAKPEGYQEPVGTHIPRNPGVALVWITHHFTPIRTDGGVLFQVYTPLEVLWFCEGRPATRMEVMESIESGLVFLREAADQDGPAALLQLKAQLGEALKLVPGK
jgi:hypothetical protein